MGRCTAMSRLVTGPPSCVSVWVWVWFCVYIIHSYMLCMYTIIMCIYIYICVGGIYRIYDRCLPSCHLLCFAMLQITASPPACAPPPTSGRSSTSVVDIDPKAFARTLNYPSLHLVPTCPNYTCFTIITTLIEDLQWGIKSLSRQKVIQFIGTGRSWP